MLVEQGTLIEPCNRVALFKPCSRAWSTWSWTWWPTWCIKLKCSKTKCIGPKMFEAKCTRLVCLLSVASGHKDVRPWFCHPRIGSCHLHPQALSLFHKIDLSRVLSHTTQMSRVPTVMFGTRGGACIDLFASGHITYVLFPYK